VNWVNVRVCRGKKSDKVFWGFKASERKLGRGAFWRIFSLTAGEPLGSRGGGGGGGGWVPVMSGIVKLQKRIKGFGKWGNFHSVAHKRHKRR